MSDNSDKKRERRSKASDDADELREIAKALPELFKAINESVPQMISGIIGSVYSPEAAESMASAVGKFYAKLIEEGIPKEVALDMTKKFVGALDFGQIIGLVSDEARPSYKRHRRIADDFDDFDEEFDEEE